MSEHLRNVKPSWIAFGWFIAAALVALILLSLTALGLVRPESAAEGLWSALALVVGFGGAGFFVGTRVNAAPNLNGLALGLFTLVAWVGLNLLLGETSGVTAWDAVDARTAAGLLVMLTAASVIGTRTGVRWARRSRR